MTVESEHPARYWHALADGRVQCDLCPRECRLREGQRGFCFVRRRLGDQMVLTTYGRSSGFCLDPIEKKPLAHFYPGTSVLSFGTAGCNLGCRFCQNWDISKAKETDRLVDQATPEQIAEVASATGARSVAFTYNDPVIFTEYAVDVAHACRARGLASVAVTAGYVNPEGRSDLFGAVDAANVDLKGFTDDFYRRITGGRLGPVLDTLRYVHLETDAWLEITTLLIGGHNDSDAELHAMFAWVREELGPDVPHHVTAFHPDWRMLDVPPTPAATLVRARQIALEEGLHFVYTGNVVNPSGEVTACTGCGTPLIARDRYRITRYRLTPDGRCPTCGTALPGRFGRRAGDFGPRRIPVTIAR
ncbi:AmmeMemoRadiSam system radical SAM enzyme [Isoptericola sp. b441]|uniref:AmmeMemoRadiSam system radical SAM enzyme n=1 Tax=Actinotalea lenta TaxID=3064654 RepID=A0ABT9DBA5_9CELL|nr:MULTISPECIES: AmmeMemoRadiSam system radical SAM enzyme [unclassified Isoptericola]MDO8107860.1 AmmeMemoRadiSam system radical SAM enzyme [Isoptericola sp. b441]MDO8120470.1 AmmeMemoRadiSam system radical SAM enzyme [Isoptericola sp. b490]